MTYFDFIFALVATTSLATIVLAFMLDDRFASFVLSLVLGN